MTVEKRKKGMLGAGSSGADRDAPIHVPTVAATTGQTRLASRKTAGKPLERFPFDEIYGLHNMPGLPVGHFETRSGPIMPAEDVFEITLRGQGGHASRPDWGREVMVPAVHWYWNCRPLSRDALIRSTLPSCP